MKEALLKYDFTDNGLNIGDYIQSLVAKQFLNEAILDCHHYHKINSGLDVHVLNHQRMFSALLEEEIQKRKKAEQGVGLN